MIWDIVSVIVPLLAGAMLIRKLAAFDAQAAAIMAEMADEFDRRFVDRGRRFRGKEP
jgi:hypothetical protein